MKQLSRLWSIWRAGRANPETIARLQQQRLARLVAYARAQAPFYSRQYTMLPSSWSPADLPPVNKPQLMDQFDD